jgi:altronate dehydratase
MLQAADLTIRLHAEDDVVIARVEIPAATMLTKENVRAAVRVPAGHKIAVRAVAKGKPVHRYNQIIGFATQDIAPGDHVHVHNVITPSAPWPGKRNLFSSKRHSWASCGPMGGLRRGTTSAS